ncbi:DUF4102 domain-containing protein [Campylobacter hyointestinalis]|uniref:Arm DNA-binding domain-containing protein n=1 Tax=Campylobacter hyointestinalis TaxID=198 RepID=UPI0009EE461F|nr:DUF4102 domain-containing protein [Campylobacter hyointestinalis]
MTILTEENGNSDIQHRPTNQSFKAHYRKNKVILVGDSATKCLYIKISNVSKIFIYRYYGNDKKEKRITTGHYPAISLHEARNKAYEYTTLRQRGHDLINISI